MTGSQQGPGGPVREGGARPAGGTCGGAAPLGPAAGPAPAGASGTPAPRDTSGTPAPDGGPAVPAPGSGPATPTPAALAALAPLTALAGGAGGSRALGPLVDEVLGALRAGAGERGGPLPAGEPWESAEAVAKAYAAAEGAGALGDLTRALAHGSADPADPCCAAHLHCPPLAVAAAADLAVSALNPSQDSWDQAPAATALETVLLGELAELVGYDPDQATGVLTSGGTESNLMGLMLARDHVGGRAAGRRIETAGLPGAALRLRVFASEAAHFSVQRSAALLGLGEDAVLPVPVDHLQRIRPEALAGAMAASAARGEVPVGVVATAGTTDTGAIDPLHACADAAAAHGAWLHVDAAYGGGALLSARLAPLLDGIARADSVSLDWHKLGWQPTAAGVFLVRAAHTYASLARRAEYLNPRDDEEAGYPSLLGLSLRTTRRADAFKIAVTLRALGREGLGHLVDACHTLAHTGADAVRAHPRLELHAGPVLTAFLFRYVPHGPAARSPERTDLINAGLRRRLLREGAAVVGRTELPGTGPGRVRLKLTLLNPHATPETLQALLATVVAAGRAEEAAEAGEAATGKGAAE